ncbi:MAG: hypothetical protein KDB23_19720 [Planctomycetales bacterium]|nr:hypothetical protein [Planctomycetales bacterium]
MRGVTSPSTTTETTTYTSSATISPADYRMVARLVGFYEYGHALRNLDQLVSICSSEELAAIDKIVGDRDEFTVYTDLGRRFQRGPSSLIAAASPTDDRAKRGLAWVMALARVELASMLVCFTATPQPYELVGPTPFDAAAYMTLLHEGALSHYWALVNDPMLEPVTRMSPLHTEVLAYSRRLVIARGLLRATMKAQHGNFSPIQLREISAWKEGLDSLQAGLVAKIELFLQHAEQRKVTKTTVDRGGEYVRACTKLLEIEQRELKAGRAKVFND